MRSEDATRHTLATVLLVAADDAVLANARERLAGAGFSEVIWSRQLERTEELLAANEPDLLLLAAGSDGLQTLAALRAGESWRQLPVIMLVPAGDDETKRETLAAGATDILATPVDASELVLRLRNALAYKAYEDRLLKRDPLTGLANRTEFMRRVQSVLARDRTDPPARSLVLLDLDRFKPINDSLGHAGGDALLRLVADRLAQVVARHGGGNRRAGSDVPTPWLARLESDRFMALLPAPTSSSRASPRRCISRSANSTSARASAWRARRRTAATSRN
jgi:PleD family two-component response regulator